MNSNKNVDSIKNDLNRDQSRVFDEIINNPTTNYFVTGCAGTGKSFLLKKLVEYYRLRYSKEFLGVTAMTGIAALNIGGRTFHSWAGLGLSGNQRMSPSAADRWRFTSNVIVDEVSMMDSEYFENIKKKFIQFKVRIIFFGDFFQLPPVNSKMIFLSQAWKDLGIKTLILKEIVRQSDNRFIEVLNNIRWNRISGDDIEWLKKYSLTDNPDLKPDKLDYTCIYPVNKYVDRHNKKELDKIDSHEYIFKAFDDFKISKKSTKMSRDDRIRTEKTLHKKIQRAAPDELVFKKGARVMLTKNQIDGPFVNGSVGTFTFVDQEEGTIWVTFEGYDNPEPIQKEQFEESYNGVTVIRHQYPLKLAWSVSIHKSQGLTMDKLWLTTEGSFEHGQCYVGISRVRDPSNLVIDDVDTLVKRIRVYPEVVDFYWDLENSTN